MKLLVLGGTRFVGRLIVDAMLASGHAVTLFNRGETDAEVFPDAEKLIGDRDGGLDILRGRSWDAVVDVNGYVPRLVEDSSRLLANAVERYVFVSTIAVYADLAPWQGEKAPLATMEDPTTEVINGETYGPLKALCETVLDEIMPNRLLIIRPGYVVGPYDYTDRFTYWLRRISQGGEMLAPGAPEAPIQFIDARDLAEFALHIIERKVVDIYNVTGPKTPITWGQLFKEANSIFGSATTFTWAGEKFLEEQEVTGRELPLWLRSEDHGFAQVNCEKAQAAGLDFRPLSETILDTREWDRAHGTPTAGLTPDREAELLVTLLRA